MLEDLGGRYSLLSTSSNREWTRKHHRIRLFSLVLHPSLGFTGRDKGRRQWRTQGQRIEDGVRCDQQGLHLPGRPHFHLNLGSQRATTDQQGDFLRVAGLTELQPCCVVWGETPRTALVRAPHSDHRWVTAAEDLWHERVTVITWIMTESQI